MDQRPTPASEGAARLGELAALFFRLGATSFGGPAAHIALMEDAIVARRGWVSREEFLDLLGAANLIPGPPSWCSPDGPSILDGLCWTGC